VPFKPRVSIVGGTGALGFGLAVRFASAGVPIVIGVWHGSAAQQAQAVVPADVRVVSAFHTVSAALLSDLEHLLDEDVLVCGDRMADKQQVIDLVERVPGLRALDCGPLEMARIVEQLTPLLISINARHKVRAGIKITGLSAG